jgi:hypothetical protein
VLRLVGERGDAALLNHPHEEPDDVVVVLVLL